MAVSSPEITRSSQSVPMVNRKTSILAPRFWFWVGKEGRGDLPQYPTQRFSETKTLQRRISQCHSMEIGKGVYDILFSIFY